VGSFDGLGLDRDALGQGLDGQGLDGLDRGRAGHAGGGGQYP
jgi:hypothetical protein